MVINHKIRIICVFFPYCDFKCTVKPFAASYPYNRIQFNHCLVSSFRTRLHRQFRIPVNYPKFIKSVSTTSVSVVTLLALICVTKKCCFESFPKLLHLHIHLQARHFFITHEIQLSYA